VPTLVITPLAIIGTLLICAAILAPLAAVIVYSGRATRRVGTVITLLTTCGALANAQTIGSILHVEFVNATSYFSGYCALADVGKNSNKLTRPTPVPPFVTGVGVADIVSVNGTPVKGTAIEGFNGTLLSPTMTSGRAIGDFTAAPTNATFELTFLNPDGTLIGTLEIHGQGTSSDLRPPGAPSDIPGGSVYSVVGGTGPFLGMRGYFAPVQDSISPERQTTDCEDPSYRRINADPGGNKRHPVLYLIPLTQPQILMTPNGPAIVHASDGTLVTTAKPAKAGEILSLFASGLGPTKPGVDPGQPFPAAPLQPVNSPVEVLVNGQPGNVSYAGGYPGAIDGYQVNFRVPDGATPGQASVQLTSAWISGPPVSMPLQ
jgi:hypothetical protein